MKAQRLKEVILQAIKYLETAGIIVKVLVLDQESTQRMAIKKYFGATSEEPWLHISGDEKIYVVWDVPHLLKNLRNTLKKYEMEVG